ncbi:MAG: mechanosensitive ion channel [Asgard group archaeon]|nr:mechanosensitive ion channel [Asgard group archaeon]
MPYSILSMFNLPINNNLSLKGERWDNFVDWLKNDFWAKISDWFSINIANVLITVLVIILLLLFTIILERVSTRLIKRFGRRNDWADEVINGMAFFGRLFIIIIGLGVIIAVGGLPEELGITITALLGATVGFASTKALGNIISGFTVLISRTFSIGDYVQIGDAEGIVCEITNNYTKLLTNRDRTILIPNQEVTQSKVIKFCTDEVSKTYTMYPSFNHTLSTKQLNKIFDKVIEKYTPERVYEIKYELNEVTHFYRKYEISFVFDYVDDYFKIPSEFLTDVMLLYDKAVARKNKESS